MHRRYGFRNDAPSASQSLRIFAVAARHLSFTKAASQLNLTQSAVSHRIKALEEQLGIILFNRLVRRLELTGAGAALAHTMRQAMHQIERGVAELDRAGGALRLSITMLPSVASRWFVPRLTRFRKQRPDIEVQVIAEPRLLDLRAEGIDLALRFGRGPYPGYAVTELMPDWVFPVCSPEFLASRRVETIEQLIELPLLNDQRRKATAAHPIGAVGSITWAARMSEVRAGSVSAKRPF